MNTTGFQDKYGAWPDVVAGLCEKLMSAGVPGLHFYTMNQSIPTLAVLQRLALSPSQG